MKLYSALNVKSEHFSFRSVSGADMYVPDETRRMLANLSLGSGDLQPPSMFHYLPHLIGKPRGLQPAFKLARGRAMGKCRSDGE